ncbi:GNAT family N-acetyltransferase [Amycolatopsis cihanbeyliensis]|uniref:Acetyltransferase (GNAT) family protein n=1 Tax=Amycolatopsis cihanbeyliensis TaxID=1128664 RepID=A0A542DS72_AMYCI|nr:GNAT family N-acetyltransferase [Amycolatopsis cihanbeyliensis]TQJ05826.1 acetyltransferase (GNAT) family protein [Amycolatopsis cihanbeyliensis]
MDIVSLGFRTDLMLLSAQGGSIERRDGYRVVRTPDNPGYHWGNFLLLDAPVEPGTAAEWVRTFRGTFPAADHLALGVDGTRGGAGDVAELAAAGLGVQRSTVLTADELRPPPRPNRELSFRPLEGEADWRGALALREAENAGFDPVSYREYAERDLAAMRRLQERGLGGWFGAFADGRMVSGLGVFADGSGPARFQNILTDPAYRGRGLAGTLVHLAGTYALEELGARLLVIVADPDYSAIRVYHSVGFAGTETQIQLAGNGPG